MADVIGEHNSNLDNSYVVYSGFQKFCARERFLVKQFIHGCKQELSNHTAIDFSGIELLTDEVFIALKRYKDTDKTAASVFNAILCVSCVGCVHLTAYGVQQLCFTFPHIKELVLDGCQQITEVILTYLPRSVKKISLKGTQVSYLAPSVQHKKENGTLDMDLGGCSLVPTATTGGVSELPKKLIIMAKDSCDSNIYEFLKSADAESKPVPSGATGMLSFWKEARLPGSLGSERLFNIYECHCKTALYSPIMSANAVYVLVVDLSMTFIVTRLNNITAMAPTSPVIVLCLHHGEKAKAQRDMKELINDMMIVGGAIPQQRAMIESHFEIEDYLKHGHDFATQQRYARSHRAFSLSSARNITVYRVDTATSEVQRNWPLPQKHEKDHSSQKYKKAVKLFKLDNLNKKYVVPANEALDSLSLDSEGITMLKTRTSAPEPADKTIEAIMVLCNESDVSALGKSNFLSSDFIHKLKNFDKDTVSDSTLRMLIRKYMKDSDLPSSEVRASSEADYKLYLWLSGMYNYALESRMIRLSWHTLAKKTQKNPVDAQKIAEEKLAEALPALEESQNILNSMNKSDIIEIKSMSKPPTVLLEVMVAMLTLFGEKDTSWSAAKRFMGDSRFLQKLITFDKDNVPMSTLKKLETFVTTTDPQMVRKVSNCGYGMSVWVRAVYKYSITLHEVQALLEASQKSESDESENQEDLKKIAEEKLAEALPALEESFKILSSLNKSYQNVAEMKNLSKPPQLLQETIAAMMTLLGEKDTSWSAAKKFMGDSKFLQKLMNFDKDNVPPKSTLKKIEKFVTTTDPQKVRNVSMCGHGISVWVDAVYKYSMTKYEVQDLMEKMQKIEADRSEFINQGPSMILKSINASARSDPAATLPELPTNLQILQRALQAVQQLTPEKVISMSELLAVMGDDVDINVMKRILIDLTNKGVLLYFEKCPGYPIITDVAWFLTMLNHLQSFKNSQEMFNKGRKLSLHPNIPLFTQNTLHEGIVHNGLKKEKIEAVLSILQYHGIVLEAPLRDPTEEIEPDCYFYLYSHIQDKMFMRSGIETVVDSNHKYRTEHWPELTQPEHLVDNNVIDYRHAFTWGFPPDLLPRLLAECSRLGHILQVWRWGFYIRCGSVEVKIHHNVHATLLSSSLDMQARINPLIPSHSSRRITREHLWGVLSQYLLVLDHLVCLYPGLLARHRIPCQGACALEGHRHSFSSVEFPSQLDGKLTCPYCDTSKKPLEPDVINFMSPHFRQGYLPFHDFSRTEDLEYSLNTVSPYAPVSRKSIQSGSEVTYLCKYCGITSEYARKLWDMETTVQPTCVSMCTLTIPEEVTVRGNIISVTQRSGVIYCPKRLFLNGNTEVSITVLTPGSIKLLFGSEEFFTSEENASKNEKHHLDLTYDLAKGEIKFPTESKASETDNQILVTAPRSVCQAGDRITVRICKEKLVDMVSHKKMRLVMEIWKNGLLICTATTRYWCYFGLRLKCSKEDKPSVLLNVPQYPGVRASHFPLGCTLLFKSTSYSQWQLGQVIGHSEEGHLKVSAEGIGGQVFSFLPDSEDIAPLNKFSDGRSVSYPKDKEEKKKKAKQGGSEELGLLKKFLVGHDSWAASFGLFSSPVNRTNNPTLRLVTHEPRFCTMNANSPWVIEQSFMDFTLGEGKNLRSSNLFFHVLMPKTIPISLILNPMRHTIQNFNQQVLHFLCKGSDWNMSSVATQRDVHFLDGNPVEVTAKELREMYPFMHCKIITQAYQHLIQNKCLLADLKIFPELQNAISENLGLDMDQISKGLREIFSLYKCSFLFLEAMLELHDQKNPLAPSKKKNDFLGRNILLSKLPAAYGNIEDEENEYVGYQKCGRCVGHESCNKKTSFRFFAKQGFPNIGIYSECITILSLAQSSLGRDSMNKFVTIFPNLCHLRLQSVGMSSLDGVGKAKHLKSLVVPGNNFTEIPTELLELKSSLEHLDVSNSEITELPDFITQFTRLRFLIAYGTSISELPENIGDLVELRILKLNHTLVNKLPDSFRNLRNLSELQMDGIPWMSEQRLDSEGGIDSAITFERFLERLRESKKRGKIISVEEAKKIFDSCDLNKNGSIDSPEERKLLSNHMYARFPRFGQDYKDGDTYGGMPSQIFSCYALRLLSMKFQGIRFVPKQIGSLNKLNTLLLANNPLLESLPGDLGKCERLRVLTLIDCPSLRTPPPEILGRGMKTLIAYLKRLSMGSTACYRTKLMYVGLGGAGKTSLMRALMSQDHMAPNIEGEAITDGIDINTWTITRDGKPLTYSVWDFAGQTVYYNTHQFFLSSRAVYVLVWNTRLGFEHSGLEFWLSSIACHCPTAPTYIVGTRADQVTNSELPHMALKKRYPNIAGFYTVSSLTGQGISVLLEDLYKVTMAQPYIGEMIPDAWIQLENSLISKRTEAKLVTWSEMEKMANHSGIYGSEIKQAVFFLHEMGSLQHFDNELLRDKVIINPQWIVDVMACVVSVQNKVIQDGHLHHKDIRVIWGNYPKELHGWLLRLTEVFDLTFPLPDQPINVIPCLLPQSEPEYTWPDVQTTEGISETSIIYNFEYLPAGLFNRAQVRLYEYSDSSAIWKTGSLLKKNGHQALFNQTSEKDILVRVCGPRPDNVLLMIHEVIEALIADFFKGVKYEYKIPCADCVKMDTKEPALFSSKVLRRAIELKALFLQCHTFFHTLSIKFLQDKMPPQSSGDYDLQLENTVNDLQMMEEDIGFDVFFLQCSADIPQDMEGEIIHPRKIYEKLNSEGYKLWYSETLDKKKVDDVAVAMQTSKVIVVLISDQFCQDGECQKMFQFIKDSLKKDFLLLMVGTGRDWMKSSIGLQVAEQVFVNFQRKHQYEEKLKELQNKLAEKLGKKRHQSSTLPDPDVFISYAWVNSQIAVDAGHARPKEGALGFGDPRRIKSFLEENNISCWLDIERTGKMGLFQDIADGIRKCKVVVACLSDESALSSNCQMEFRFAHVSMHKPIIVAAVGTGLRWQSTEIGMLSLEYPKINFQVNNNLSYNQLLTLVKDTLQNTEPEEIPRSITPALNDQKEKAFQELYEMAQRKFLRQISMYVASSDHFPRVFVADLNYDPSETADNQVESSPDDIDMTIDEEEKPMWVAKDLQAGQFCIKTLCEYEGGWHTADAGVPVELSGDSLVQLWEMTAPYMARILAILKHSPVNLHIIRTNEGEKLINIIEQKIAESKATLKQVYLALRSYMIAKDVNKTAGNLKRCYLPSGKILWLCPEHQGMSRVTVLDDDDEEVEEEGQGGEGDVAPTGQAEEALVQQLTKLAESASLINELGKLVDVTKETERDGDNVDIVPKKTDRKTRPSSATLPSKNKPANSSRPKTPDGEDIAASLGAMAKLKKSEETKEEGPQQSGDSMTRHPSTSSITSKKEVLTEEKRNQLARKASSKAMAMTSDMSSKACTIV